MQDLSTNSTFSVNSQNVTTGQQSTALAIFSPDVPDLSNLIKGLEPGVKALILKADGTELEQIANTLKGGNYSALHLFSHGAPGTVFLGQTNLTANNIDEYASIIQEWQQGLAPGADVLLYGCDIGVNQSASTENQLLQRLHQLTGADIAASNDLTGNSQQGGDWDLELKLGEISSPAVFKPEITLAYQGVLGAGDLDTTFNGTGKVTTDFGTSTDVGRAMTIDSSGKILVAGYTDNGSNFDIALTRYNSDGSLDTSFGTGGIVTTDFSSSDDYGYAMTIDSSGKILVAGFSNNDFALTRYNSDGSLDTTFDTDGKVTTDFSSSPNFGSPDYGYAMTIDSSGKILVAGYAGGDFGLTRYNSDGSLDTTFGTGGKVTTHFGSSTDLGDDYGNAMTIDSSGKILVAGYTDNGSNTDIALTRYNSDGSLDTTFDTDGKVTTAFGRGENSGDAMTIDSSGKILVAGSAGLDFALVRYNSDGSLDTTFDTDGKVTTNFGTRSDYGKAMTIDSSGKILVAGATYNGSGDDFALARYNSDGSLDTTFGTGGKVTTAIGSGDDSGKAMTIDSSGKILVAGSSNADFALARYGTPDIAVTTPAVPAVTVAPSNTNKVLYEMDLAVTGAWDTKLTGLTLTTGGTYQTTDVSNFKLWYSTDKTFDAADTQLASLTPVASGGSLAFTGLSQAITKGTTGYLFLTTDIAPNATDGKTINLAAPSLTNITFDSAMTTGTPTASNNLTIDAAPPTVTLSSTNGTTVNAPFTITATFSEDVKNFVIDDIVVGNGTVSNFTTVDAKTYKFDVTPTGAKATVDVPAAVATDLVGNNNIAATQLTLTKQPDLIITNTAPAKTAINTPFDYSLQVANNGGTDASGIEVKFTLPTGVTYNSNTTASGFTGTQSGNVVTFSGGTLAASANTTLKVNVTPTKAGTLTSDAGAGVVDPNNTITETNETNNSTAVTTTTVESFPDLSINNTAPPTTTVNTPFDYSLQVANSGTADATGITANFTLPAGVKYNSSSTAAGFTATQSGNIVTFSGGTLAGGANTTLKVNVTPSNVGTLTSDAGAGVVDPANTITESNETNNSTAAVTTTVAGGTDLIITNTAPAKTAINKPFDYSLQVSNSGSVNANNVEVKFTLPTGVTYNSNTTASGFTATQSGNVVTFSGGTLAGGANTTLKVNVTPTKAGTLTSDAGAGVVDPSNTITETNETNNTTAVTTTTVESFPDLSINNTAPPTATVNTPFDYSLQVANSGTADATGITANFTLPAGVKYNSSSTAAGFTATQSGNIVTFSGGTLAGGANTTLKVNVTPSNVGTLTSDAGAGVVDPANTITESNETNNSTAVATTNVQLEPDLTQPVIWQEQGPRSIQGGANVRVEKQNQAGALNTVVAHPTDPNIMWVGSVNGGIWKTMNATASQPTWTSNTDNLSSLSIAALDLDLSDPSYNTLIAGVGSISSLGGTRGQLTGINRSIDGGNTWTTIGTDLANKELDIRGVVANGNIIMAASNGGVLRSTNGKDANPTFTQMQGTNGLQADIYRDIVKDPNNPNNYYVSGLKTGIYRTTDAGATWTKISNGVTGIGNSTSNLKLALHSKNGVVALYAGVINSDKLDGVWRTDNNGATWTKMDIPTTTEEDGTKPGINPGGQGDIHFSIGADPNNPNLVYVGGDRQPENPKTGSLPNSLGATGWYGLLFRGDASKTPGSQWTPIVLEKASGTSPHPDSRDMAFDANGNLLETNDGGVYKRVNPATDTGIWSSLNGNIGVTELHSIDYDRNTGTVLGGAQDNGSNEGPFGINQQWNEINGGDGGRVRVDDLKREYSLRYSSAQRLGNFHYRQIDSQTRVPIKNVSPNLAVKGTNQTLNNYEDKRLPFITPVELNKVKSDWLVIGGNKGVYESKDRGATVTDLVNKTLTSEVKAIAFGGKSGGVENPDVLYVTSGNQVYLRKAAGQPLTPVASPGNSSLIEDIVLDPNDWNKAYLVAQNGIFRTTNAGTSWDNITGNINSNLSVTNSLQTIEYVPGGKDGLLVGGFGGVYFISNPATANNPTWTKFGNGMPNIGVYDLNYDPTVDVLVAGTLGRGAWAATNVVQAFGGTAPPALPPIPTKTSTSVPSSGSTKPTIDGPAVPGQPRLFVSNAELPQDILEFAQPEDNTVLDDGEPASEPAPLPALFINISLDQPVNTPVTVNVTTEDGTAKAGSDYLALNENITFDPGVVSREIRIEIPLDQEIEPDQFFYVNLTSANGAQIAKAKGKVILTAKAGTSEDEIQDGTQYDDSVIGGLGNDTMNGFEGDDTIDGSVGDDLIDGGDNDDSILGGDGNDTITGGSGDDTIDGGNGDDSIDAGEGDDSIIASAGNDTINGGIGIDTLSYGTSPTGVNINLTTGNITNIEVIVGSPLNDTITTGNGDDTIIGNGGADSLQGGLGNDVYMLDPTKSAGTKITDAGGDNTLKLNGVTLSVSGGGTSVLRDGTNLYIDLNQDGKIDPATDIAITNFFASATGTAPGSGYFQNVGNLSGTSILNVLGQVSPSPTPNIVVPPIPIPTPTPTPVANPGQLVQVSTPKAVILSDNSPSGLPEKAYSWFGHTLTDNDDTTILGGLGAPVLALSGHDSVLGSADSEIIFGNQGNDTLDGDANDDVIYGGKGSDSIIGGTGNDLLNGNNHNDTLLGGNDHDTLRGGKEDDVLFGGDGNDVLTGDRNFDILTGGNGNDTFVIANDPEERSNLSRTDLITDFQTSNDFIQLPSGVSYANLTFEAVNLQWDNQTPVASTAIKSGDNYLAQVLGVIPSSLTATVFI